MTVSTDKTSYLPWIIWGLACLFYFYENLLQVSPSVIGSELMRDFHVTGQTLGVLSGVYFYSYAGMQLPGGLLMDYFGPKRLLTIATFICALGSIAFGLTENFFMACLARFMIGLGSAFSAVGTMKVAASWFNPRRFAVLTGLMVTVGMSGAIGGEAPLAILIEHYGWRHGMIIMGGLGVLLAFAMHFISKDAPNSRMGQHRQQHELSLLQSLSILMRSPQLWIISIYGGCMYLFTPVFCGLWGVPFLMQKLFISKIVAANYVSMVFVGWVIASPLWGAFSNYIGRRKPPLFLGSFFSLILCLIVVHVPMSDSFLMPTLLFLLGIFSAAFLPAFTVAVEICNRRYAATCLGFMNMMNMIGAALVQPFIGMLLDRAWHGEIVNHVRVYSLGNYTTALSILPFFILVSLLLTPFIKETYCQSVTSEE